MCVCVCVCVCVLFKNLNLDNHFPLSLNPRVCFLTLANSSLF